MTTVVTGAAGFIGFHVAKALLDRGETVLGVDNLNSYYDVRLKKARLARLTGHERFRFAALDIADRAATLPLLSAARPTGIIHLAAQAGVRHSLVDPYAYVEANLMGQVVMLEAARSLSSPPHFVYASSSSVYGGNRKTPFSTDDPVDRPVSLYAATKKADELITHSYSHLFRIPATGLRFFTVYGPWGRPDMAAFLFADAIMTGRAIRVFNHGDMRRDFTYIDDIVGGIVRASDRPAAPDPDWDPRDPDPATSNAPFRLYNIGNNAPVQLGDFVVALEAALGRKATFEMRPLQPGDALDTFADSSRLARELNWRPATPVEVGVARFAEWYRGFYGEGAPAR